MLAGIERLDVEADDLQGIILEERPGTGGEVLQARADSKHHVGLFCERVGCGGSGHADRAHVERV
ncbi:hypothetical protein D9M68_923730 [compost metagenome]